MTMNTSLETSITAKSCFRKIGLALLTAAATTAGIQAILGMIAKVLAEHGSPIPDAGWFLWVATFAPLYAVGIPLGLLVMRKCPIQKREPLKLGGKNFFLFLLMCFPLMYAGSLIGNLLSNLFSNGTATNGLYDYAFDKSPLKILVIVFLAPLLEEYLFRKQIIDRCSQYGEKTAILFSALAFGLFHMNLFQFFYAFGIGLVFGYVYLRTRRLHYSVIMHMIINFIGSVLAPLMLSKLGDGALEQLASGQMDDAAIMAMLPDMMAFIFYVLVILGLSIAGLVILIVKIPKLTFLHAEEELVREERFKTVYTNVGAILFILFCVVFIILNLI